MTLVFRKRKHVRRWGALDALAQRRAALLWRFTGADEWPTVDDALADEAHARWTVRDERGVAVAEWWQFEDGGLLFAGTSDRPIGYAIQRGFVCEDRALWSALERAQRAPSSISWALDDGARQVAPLWPNATVVDEALAAVLHAREPSSARTGAATKRPTKAQRPATKPSRTKKNEPSETAEPTSIGVEKQSFERGEPVFVLYNGRWYSGRIERVEGEARYQISYDGWHSGWNEVVGLDRVRGTLSQDAAPRAYDSGALVFVEYGRVWYPGRIERVESDGRYLISYDGWGDDWNEVVGLERLTPARARMRA